MHSRVTPIDARFETLFDWWIYRRATARPEALAAVSELTPAVAVTGGSRGIGLAIARRFARAGHPLILIARSAADLASAKEGIQQDNPTAPVIPIALDITSGNAAAIIETESQARGFYVDILVNCAGHGLSGPLCDHKDEAIERLVALNIAALTRMTKAFAPPMRARARGGIINVASLGGYVPGPYQALYYASKAYVLSLTEALAAEMAGSGVRVSVLAPGPVATDFHAAMGAGRARYRSLIPEQSAEKIAHAAYRGYFLGRRVIVPGLFNTAASLVLRVLPHTISVPIMKWLLDPGQQREGGR